MKTGICRSESMSLHNTDITTYICKKIKKLCDTEQRALYWAVFSFYLWLRIFLPCVKVPTHTLSWEAYK